MVASFAAERYSRPVELQRQLAPNQFMHIQHGILCHGTEIRPNVFEVKNCTLDSQDKVTELVATIRKHGAAGVEHFLAADKREGLVTEFVIGSACKTTLWHTNNLARKIEDLENQPRPNLSELIYELRGLPIISSSQNFPEKVPFARFPDSSLWHKRIGVICIECNDTGLLRYSTEHTHAGAYHAIYQELLLNGVSNPRFVKFPQAYSAHFFMSDLELAMIYSSTHYPKLAFFTATLKRALGIFNQAIELKEYEMEL